ncbi:hypothetical protein J7K24_02860 [bacterium]|nr:hypothetical protein [bacterium]
MNHKRMFSVKKIKPSASDERGPTYEWKHPDGRQITVIVRKKGSRIGGHYHKGKDPDKNPEKLFVAKGKMKAIFANEEGMMDVQILEEGDYFTIPAGVAHGMVVLEDLVLLEYRLSHYDRSKKDTYPTPWIFDFLK